MSVTQAVPKTARLAQIRLILQSEEIAAIHSLREEFGMSSLNEVVRSLIGEALERRRDGFGKSPAR